MAALLVELLDFELSQIAGFEFSARRTLAPAHVGASDGRRVVSEANSGLVPATVNLSHQARQVTARSVFIAIPIRIFVAGQLLGRGHATVGRGGNRFVRRTPTAVSFVVAAQARAHD